MEKRVGAMEQRQKVFEPGELFIIRSLVYHTITYPELNSFVVEAFKRYAAGDWGKPSKNRERENRKALREGWIIRGRYELPAQLQKLTGKKLLCLESQTNEEQPLQRAETLAYFQADSRKRWQPLYISPVK